MATGEQVQSEPVAVDPVEAALAQALALAARAARWTTVDTLARELSERRRARVAPGVASLGDARANRERGE